MQPHATLLATRCNHNWGQLGELHMIASSCSRFFFLQVFLQIFSEDSNIVEKNLGKVAFLVNSL